MYIDMNPFSLHLIHRERLLLSASLLVPHIVLSKLFPPENICLFRLETNVMEVLGLKQLTSGQWNPLLSQEALVKAPCGFIISSPSSHAITYCFFVCLVML